MLNKRLAKIVEKLQNGIRKNTVRRDQIKKALQEGGFDYIIDRDYDEVYNIEPKRIAATIENVPDSYLNDGTMWASFENDGKELEITIQYGYCYMDLRVVIDKQKEKETTEPVPKVVESSENVEVMFNEEKNGIEIKFDGKPSEEIREAMKANGFRWSRHNKVWWAKDTQERREFVGTLVSEEEIEEYTIETLKMENLSYNMQHRVIDRDVEKVNKMKKIIESSRKQVPQVGDIVQFTDRNGNYSERAHIDNVGDQLYICEHAGVPFVSASGDTISTSTSGGAWTYIPNDIKLVGTSEKRFKIWGHCGATANGAVEFKATVNVWEYTEDPELEFTTKTHDKQHFFVRSETNSGDRYKYKGDGIAFENDEMFSAYLQTFRGVVKKGNWENQLIVWAYQNTEIICKTVEEYNQVDGIVDTWLCNGIRECKRVYNDDKFEVLTYVMPRDEMFELDPMDWRTHSHLEYALKNPMKKYDINSILNGEVEDIEESNKVEATEVIEETDPEVEELKLQAGTLQDMSFKIISENNISETWTYEDWQLYKKLMKEEVRKNNFELSRDVIYQLDPEYDEFKQYMIKLLDSMGSIQDQFDEAELKRGNRITIIQLSDFIGVSVLNTTVESLEHSSYAQYDDAIKLIHKPKRKRDLRKSYLYKKDMIVYKGWIDFSNELLMDTVKDNDKVTVKKSRYMSCDIRQLDEVLNYFEDKGIKPIINLYEPE